MLSDAQFLAHRYGAPAVDAWDVIGKTCVQLEEQRGEYVAQQRVVTRQCDDHRVVHEVPRKSTENGYVYDV